MSCQLRIIREGLKARRSKRVRGQRDSTDGDIQVVFLPPCAPVLNPVEFPGAWPRRHALATFCPNNPREMNTHVCNTLQSAQRRPSVIAVCGVQAELW